MGEQWIAESARDIYAFLLPFAQLGFAIVVLILLPMALIRRTRGAAATGMIIGSYLFGLTTWFLVATPASN
ncbi:MAG: hypothetical protein MI755_10575 [Sphingomonadales bacterium]|nr:hypothetical protein [Sphingomonadales bacterium]